MPRNLESPQKITGALVHAADEGESIMLKAFRRPRIRAEITWAFRTGQGPEIRQWRRW